MQSGRPLAYAFHATPSTAPAPYTMCDALFVVSPRANTLRGSTGEMLLEFSRQQTADSRATRDVYQRTLTTFGKQELSNDV